MSTTRTRPSKRASELAAQFEAAVEEAAAVFAELRREQWTLPCPGEGRTVAAVARHIASAIPFEMRAFMAMADGQEFESLRWEQLHELNAERGAANAEADIAETIALLRRNAGDAAREVRALTDKQLGRRGVYIHGLPEWTVEELLERILVSHITGHLKSIRAAIE